MAALTVQRPTITSPAVTLAAAAGGGDTIKPGENTYLLVRNADASSKTVTVVRAGTEYGQANPDVATVVLTLTTVLIPIPKEFRDSADGLVDITYSAVTSLTVAALEL